MNPGEIHVWTVQLDDTAEGFLLPATAAETARSQRFHTEVLARRYLRSHRALRTILSGLTERYLTFAVQAHGKPYLPLDPSLCFNLSHSHEVALVAAAMDVEVGIDIERLRPMSDFRAIADRFFPPSEAAALLDERDFFRRWTRIEAMLKATGQGLYGAGRELDGEWTVEELAAPEGFAAAVAAVRSGMTVVTHEFGADE